MSGTQGSPPQPTTNKTYGAHKVSEYTHDQGGKSYRVDESEGVPARQSTQANKQLEQMAERLEAQSKIDHQKKHKLGKDSEEFKAEYKTTRDAIGDLTPYNFRKQLAEIKSLTPEEYETILLSLHEAKMNAKLYAVTFAGLAFGFTYWQRAFVPRSFFFLSITLGMLSGVTYGLIRTGWHLVENVDALGKDYEISRMMKQDIFDSRPDLDSGMRAQYYIHQSNQRYEWEKQQNKQ